MCTVSPLTFDFNKLEVTLEIGGRKLTLVGSLKHGECKNDQWEEIAEVDTV